MPELLSQSERKSNRRQVCNYCGETIAKGETYNHAKIKFDYIYEWEFHLKCIEIATALTRGIRIGWVSKPSETRSDSGIFIA